MNYSKIVRHCFWIALLLFVKVISIDAQGITSSVVKWEAIPTNVSNAYYPGHKAPLLPEHFTKLPVTAFQPGGWLKKQLELQRDGLTGHLGEISIWLSKTDNAWMNKEGSGKYGWEELPYWLKGYANIGYMLRDKGMISEAKTWIEYVLNGQRENGDFGPM